MWEQIRANRRKAVWLILLMVLLMLALGYCVGEAFDRGLGPVGLIIGFIVFMSQMGVYAVAGEAVLMTGLGGREIAREESPRLFNIVEEMQLASGLGYTPKIYLIDNDSPNAFAIGHKPEKSAIAVTRGLMYRLNRDELQGVIAHEVAHLKNLDAKFMTLAGVMLGSIIILADMSHRMLFYGNRTRTRSNSRNSQGAGQAQLIFLVLALLLIVLGPVLARLLYFALSRSREFLADASSAVYTRYPEGLASALEKIAGTAQPFGEVNRVVAPMFIVNPLQASGEGSSLFATHPPLFDRVKVLRGMGGASFLDYDAAYRGVKGRGIIGRHTLQESERQTLRGGSMEGPIETRPASKAVVNQLYGYTTVMCQCGAKLNVPPSYMEDTVRCIRCGLENVLPPLEDRIKAANAAVGASAKQEEPKPWDREPTGYMDYTRVTPGQWETFPCQCGNAVQLSPMFSAPMIDCRKCGTRIRVHDPQEAGNSLAAQK